MPPKDKGKGALKQKSLVSFFSKPGGGASASQGKPQQTPVIRKSSALTAGADASSPAREPYTPKTKANARTLSSSVIPSSASSRAASTPPTSDAIDVDMLSEGEEREQQAYAKSGVSLY